MFRPWDHLVIAGTDFTGFWTTRLQKGGSQLYPHIRKEILHEISSKDNGVKTVNFAE
jgi:hypothetical protein